MKNKTSKKSSIKKEKVLKEYQCYGIITAGHHDNVVEAYNKKEAVKIFIKEAAEQDLILDKNSIEAEEDREINIPVGLKY